MAENDRTLRITDGQSSAEVKQLPVELLDWGRDRLRDLPWRQVRDRWSILVSEVMLQQTQVARVGEYWWRFLDRFPTPASCAEASAGEVITEWSGLGYNRRPLNLHRTATAVVDRHGGVVPAVLADLLALPGIGPYTARAVLAFADEADVGVVDTNVARVLARWGGRRLTGSEVQCLADASVPLGEGWAWNQVVLDLGATICRARTPECRQCPLNAGCGWRQQGDDPAIGSAGVSRQQKPFLGSDRQGRGLLITALTTGPVAISELAKTMGWPDDDKRVARVVASLVAEGLVISDGSCYTLPGD